MNRFLFFLLFGMCGVFAAAGQGAGPDDIPGFTVRESEADGQRIEMVALDKSGEPFNDIHGVYHFSVNGLGTDVKFEKGRAAFAREVSSSTFLYIKYDPVAAAGEGRVTLSELFYVYRGSTGGYTIIHIPLALLVIIPLALILLGVFFRRLIIIALLLLGAFFYFNNLKGLSLDSFFDAAKEWINGLL